MKEARPGLSERRVATELEGGFQRAGARRPAFESIVASGPNSATLHAEPTDRELAAGELLLIDAGAEVDGYACDCTRTWVLGGRPTAEQKDLHQLVRSVQEAAIARCVPGREYREIHLEAHSQFAQGLVDFGLLKGSPASLLERDAPALLWPHGIGHLVGLAVHDVGGYAPGRPRSDRPALRWLRADLPLAAGMAVTIEPGIYFIAALLDDPEVRNRYRDAVDWLRVDALRSFGGIRIEDTLLVTAGEPEVLTRDIPKGIAI
jgi:Xaa-Pro aminopeptidase